MKCIYCGAEMKNGSMYCLTCGKEIQLVSDSNVLEDDYLNNFLEEENNKKGKNRKNSLTRKQNVSTPQKTGDTKNGKSQKPNLSPSEKKQQKRMVIVSIAVMLFVIAIVIILIAFLIHNNHENSFTYQVEQGQKAADAGKNESAISYYERALKLDKDSVSVRVALGDIYLLEKDYDSAQIMYQEAVNLEDTNIQAYEGLLKVYNEQGQYDKITEVSESITNASVLDALSDYLVAAPEFSAEGGEYEDAVELTLSSDEGYKIYYTTDGKDPIQYGSVYMEPFEFSDDGEYTVSAVCVNDSGVYSATVTQEYTVNIAAPELPMVSPEGGNFGALTYITVSVPEGCTAYYTWDGTDPNITSKKYISPIAVPAGSNVFSVVIVDDRTEKMSEIYRSNYTYYEQ